MARHVYRCPLRWADMDAYGHVNNVVFLRYLEEARIDFMFRLAPGEGTGTEPGPAGASFRGGSVVARHEIDYCRQLVHRYEPVTVELWVTEVKAASTTLAYEVRDQEEVYVRASTVVVPYDFAAGRPRRISTDERAFLEKYLEENENDGIGGEDRMA